LTGWQRAVAGLAAAVILAACAPSIQPPAPTGPSFDNGDLRFVAPSGWQTRASTEISFGSGVVVYVANQPLHDDCSDHGSQVICQAPIDNGLRPGGMLVTWTTANCVAQTCDLPSAPLISIGNRQGVRVPMTAGCEGSGFTERSAYYVAVSPQRVDLLYTCARDPSDGTRSAFLGFLDAIQWRIP